MLSEAGSGSTMGDWLLTPPNGDSVFLGLDGARPLFAPTRRRRARAGRPAGLREAATDLPAGDAALGAYAASLISWHRRHRFCANCGAPTEPRARRPPAQVPVLRRVSLPAHRSGGDHAGHRYRPAGCCWGARPAGRRGRFSVLAGFVEPGETLEEAVAREVLEESGVEVAEAGLRGLPALALPQFADDRFQRPCGGAAILTPATRSWPRCAGSNATRWRRRRPAPAASRCHPATRSPGALSTRGSLLRPLRIDLVDRRERAVGRPVRSGLDGLRAAGEAVEHAVTPAIASPSSRMRSIAWTVEPPVVTTSSTTRQRSPGSSSGPSTHRCSPCCFLSLRTKKALTARRRPGRRTPRDRRPWSSPRPRWRPPVRPPPSRARPARGSRRAAEWRVWRRRSTGGAPAGEGDLADHQRVLAQRIDQRAVASPIRAKTTYGLTVAGARCR